MSVGSRSPEEIRLSARSRLAFDSKGAVRIRTGIWNYEEAIIDFSQEPADVADVARRAFAQLASGGAVDLAVEAGALGPKERAAVLQLFTQLQQAGLVETSPQRDVQDAMVEALLGRRSPLGPRDESAPPARPLAFLTDNRYCRDRVGALASDLSVSLDVVDEGILDTLQQIDLTTKVDAVATEAELAGIAERFRDAAVVVSCFSQASLVTLRNVNRVLERIQKPGIFGFIDGPFLAVLGISPPYTGCFECFELRSLARLEDHVTYQDFARSRPAVGDEPAAYGLLGLLLNLTMTEGFLWSAAGTSRFNGRVLNIYLPSLDIQTQDVLRMPGCPACGQVSRQRLREINMSTRAVIDRVISKALQ
jgi:thiazole/oxazole-forming peptide maturase SagC family component